MASKWQKLKYYTVTASAEGRNNHEITLVSSDCADAVLNAKGLLPSGYTITIVRAEGDIHILTEVKP